MTRQLRLADRAEAHPAPSRDACPFTLDALMAADFDVEAATARIAAG